MPDQRRHRGPHPEDDRLFAKDQVPRIQSATDDLSWLLSHGYAVTSSLKLVGDRYNLDARQRIAVARSACSDDQREQRKSTELEADDLVGHTLWIDGFNLLTTVEAALSGGVILVGRDGSFRDMASMHGTYKRVDETLASIEMIGRMAERFGASGCHWLLDQPVSNSGRLKTMLREVAEANKWNWDAQLVSDPDADLKVSPEIVVSADSQILDSAARWFNLARHVIDASGSYWRIDLSAKNQ